MNVMNIRYIIVAVILMACGLASAGNERASGYHFKTVDRHFDSIAARVLNDEFNRKHTPEAVSNIAKLKKMASGGSSVMKARAALWGIRTAQLDASSDSCILVLEKVKSAVPKEYDYDRAVISYQLAGNYERTGNYLNTYQLLQEAIPVLEKYGDDYFLGNAHLLMGLMYSDIGDPELAMDEIHIADRHYRQICVNRTYGIVVEHTRYDISITIVGHHVVKPQSCIIHPHYHHTTMIASATT